MEKSGIKRIDEAQRLLEEESKESGMEFFLVVCGSKFENMGTCLVGAPNRLATVCAAYAQTDEVVKSFVDGLNKAVKCMKDFPLKQ